MNKYLEKIAHNLEAIEKAIHKQVATNIRDASSRFSSRHPSDVMSPNTTANHIIRKMEHMLPTEEDPYTRLPKDKIKNLGET